MYLGNLSGKMGPIDTGPGSAKPTYVITEAPEEIDIPLDGDNYHLVWNILERIKFQKEISQNNITFLGQHGLSWVVPSFLVNTGNVELTIVTNEEKQEYLDDPNVVTKDYFHASSYRNALDAFNTIEARLSKIIYSTFMLLEYAGGDGSIVTDNVTRENLCTRDAAELRNRFSAEGITMQTIGRFANPPNSIPEQKRRINAAKKLVNEIKQNSIYVITELRALERELNRTRLPLPINLRQFVSELDMQVHALSGEYEIMPCEGKFIYNSIDMKGDSLRLLHLFLMEKQLRQLLPELKDTIRTAIIEEGLKDIVSEESLRLETALLQPMSEIDIKAEIEQTANRIMNELFDQHNNAANERLYIINEINYIKANPNTEDQNQLKSLYADLEHLDKNLIKIETDFKNAEIAQEQNNTGNYQAAVNTLKPKQNYVLPVIGLITAFGILS